MWCVGELNEEFCVRMHELLELYALPYDPVRPVVGLDQKEKQQLLAETRDVFRGKDREADSAWAVRWMKSSFSVSVRDQCSIRSCSSQHCFIASPP